MKILFQECVYETSDKLTIDRMLNNGGKVIENEPKAEENNFESEERRTTRSRRRKLEW